MSKKPKKEKIGGFFKELKNFLSRGNVISLAVGVVIGAAFGKITASLVSDIIMPPIGLLIGGVDFAELKWVLKPAVISETEPIAEVAIRFGLFIQTILEFIIIGLSLFLMVRLANKISTINLKKIIENKKKQESGDVSETAAEGETAPEPAAEPAKPTAEDLLADIKTILIETQKNNAKNEVSCDKKSE